jgi:hypothetical protein
MLQVNSLCRSIGILNLEWVVLPPKNNKDAIPDEATVSTILPCPYRRDKSVVQTNVLLVPPLPYTKNSLPSLFVFEIFFNFIDFDHIPFDGIIALA